MPQPSDDVDPYDEPDPRVLWRWAGRATRPWLGWVLVAAGALLVLLGYLGVSRESIVEKQVPYLVSGGIGGVLLCVLGAYVLATEELRKDSGRLDRLEAMVEDLHAALLSRPDAPAPVPAESEAVAVERSEATAEVDPAPAPRRRRTPRPARSA